MGFQIHLILNLLYIFNNIFRKAFESNTLSKIFISLKNKTLSRLILHPDLSPVLQKMYIKI